MLNPVAQLAADLGEPPSAPQRPPTLEGCRVGLYWNRKPGGNYVERKLLLDFILARGRPPDCNRE